jgi:hypothetical protein
MSFGLIMKEQVPISVPNVKVMVVTLTPAIRLNKWFAISSTFLFAGGRHDLLRSVLTKAFAGVN